jgi:hypothetical protein
MNGPNHPRPSQGSRGTIPILSLVTDSYENNPELGLLSTCPTVDFGKYINNIR